MQASMTVKNGAGETLAHASGSPSQVGKAMGKIMAERGENVAAQVRNLRKGQDVILSEHERLEQDALLDNVASRAEKVNETGQLAVKLGQDMVRMGVRYHKLHDQQERVDVQAQMLKTTILVVASIDEQIALLQHSRKDTLSRLKGVVDIDAKTLKRLMAERRTTEKQLQFGFEQERKAMKVWHDLLDHAKMERATDE